MAAVQLLGSDQEAEWLAALRHSFQHDFYHLPQYHALAERQGEGSARLLVYRDGEYQIALPFLVRSFEDVPGLADAPPGWRDVTSVYGYAGPVASHPQLPAEAVRGFQKVLGQVLGDLGVVTLFARLHPFIPQAPWLAGLGACERTAETVSIDLTLPPDGQWAKYRRSHRQSIYRLRREGLTVRRDPEFTRLDEFLRLYYETMRRVGAVGWFFFARPYFEYLISRVGRQLQLFTVEEGRRVVCGGLFFVCDGIVQHHLGGTLNDGLSLAPMKLLVDAVREWATAEGLRVLHLGGGTTARPDDSLLYFKRGFSDRRHPFLTWRWPVRPEAYQRLRRMRQRWNERAGCRPRLPDYFPEYRCPTAAVAAEARPLAGAGAAEYAGRTPSGAEVLLGTLQPGAPVPQ